MVKLKSLANKVQTAVIVLLVTMLSLVFVLEFGGPQSQGCAGGGGSYAARVDGHVITEGDFEAAYTLANFSEYPPDTQRDLRLKEITLHGLIERSLLAREARDMGFEVSEEDVWRKLGENGTVHLTLGVDAPGHLPQGEIAVPVRNEEGQFETEQARRFIQFYLRRSVGEFGEAQVQEMLAERARQVVRSTISVSPQELWDAYVREQEQVQIGYVQFSPAYYRSQAEVSDAQLEAWMQKHDEELEREYQANAHRYTDLEKQVRARHILIKASSEADEATRAEKRAQAERLLAQVREGGDFAELAGEHSEDPGSATRGGDLGWNPEGRMVPEFDEVQFSLEPGQVSDVVETEFGFHIIKVEGVREGDVPKQEAKREIAERLYAERRAEQLAREAAQDALAALDEGTDLETLDLQLGGPKPDDESAEDDRDPNAPKVVEPQPFARGDNPLPAGTNAAPLVTAAFDRTEDDPLPDEPLKVGNDWFVFKVLEHTEAKREDFAGGTKERLLRNLKERKAEQALRVYVQRLREEAEADDVIQVNEAVLSYGDDNVPTEAS